ncbi:aliphatic sulfonate ABC transporter substrate-binding protein [Synechocystis sp. FACHB-383]|nr:aliphatic sulfonate ABC transporter substrate-binding protein [Synechocystis sp. FACHB-383]
MSLTRSQLVRHRLIILFFIGFFLSYFAGLILGPDSVSQTSGSTANSAITSFRLPSNTIRRLVETILLFIGGIILCILLDRWFFKRSNSKDNTLLVQEAQRLKRLNIGYPEGMINLIILKEQKLLEKQLEPLGVTVTWTSFLSASSLIEALSKGSIDFCGGGGTASIFSQAAEHVFMRVAKEKYTVSKGQAILVLNNSPIKNIKDLKGKKVAFDQGSSAHYVLVKALNKVGLDYTDIDPVYLTQPEALPKFYAGEVDAWVVWVPYTSTAVRSNYPGRVLVDLEDIFGDQASLEVPTLYYAIPELVRDYPNILKVILEEVNEAGTWAKKQELEAAKRLVEHHQLDPAILISLQQRSIERAIIPIDNLTLDALQRQANMFSDLKLILERINVKDGTYSLQTRQNWTY